MIRDVTVPRNLTDLTNLADLATTAASARLAHRSQKLLDSVITSSCKVGLSPQAAADLPHAAAREGIADALRHLDDTIRQIRDTAFTARGH